MKYKFTTAFLILFLTACGGYKYTINGSVSRPNEIGRNELRSYWQSDSLNPLSSSNVPHEKTQRVLELISLSESSVHGSCKNLELKNIRPEPLIAFTVSEPGGSRKTYSPHQFLESWYVNACGNNHRWRVFDDPNEADNGVTALLYAKP